ncbi:hypothetical protein GQ53DRAFT_209146 [Thozetella sp. PMI_491]|nr:hypothetical protein GQ53DRAFT_209146 [Thozetella sp. PMI_491]
MSVCLPSNEAAVATYAWLRLCGESGRPKPDLRRMVGHASVVDIALQLVPNEEWAPWLMSQQLAPVATDLFETPTPELVSGSEVSPDSWSDDERDETYEDMDTIEAVPVSDDTLFYDTAFPVAPSWICSQEGRDRASCSAEPWVIAAPSREPKLQSPEPSFNFNTLPDPIPRRKSVHSRGSQPTSPATTTHYSKKRPQHLKLSESGRGVWPSRRTRPGIQKTGFHAKSPVFEDIATVEHVERPGCGEARWTECLQSLVI